MTDEQIIKALDCCHSELGNMCSICPLFDADNDYCEDELHKSTLDLISRQKAEIKRITEKYNCQQTVYVDLSKIINEQAEELKQAKSEAIKEFARELKCGVPQETGVIRCKDIDDLVKQMTEVQK